jgi:hypothetical protein
MEACDLAVSATINGKEQPNRLYVHGSVLTYSANDVVTVEEVYPQGINERILIVEVKVEKHPGPMKGTCRPFAFTKDVDGRQYDQVAVRLGLEHDVVDVSYLG